MSQNDLPELQEHPAPAQEGSVETKPAAKTPKRPVSAPPASLAGGQVKSARSAARAAARRTIAVLEADASTRALASSLLGVKSDDPVELVAAIVVPSHGVRPAGLLNSIQELARISDPMERVLAFAGVDREKMRQMRQAMSGLGLVEGNTPSGSEVSMAVELASAAAELNEDEAAMARLDAVLGLLD